MLEIREIDELPRALPLTEWAEREINKPEGSTIIRRSAHVWSLTDNGETLFILGVIQPTFMTVPELWLVMCKGFSKSLRRNLRFIHARFDELLDQYPRLEVKVDAEFPAGLKFARAMHFIERDRKMFNDGKLYVIFEVRRGS